MKKESFSVLIADDDVGDRKHIRRALVESNLECQITETSSFDELISACNDGEFDCALVDYNMPGRSGLEGISRLHVLMPYASIIMVTGQGDEKIASEAFKRGASDYIPKSDINSHTIRRVIEQAIEKAALKQKIAEKHKELENFAHVLAHDLRAPLMVMKSLANSIKEGIREGTSSENISKYCDRIILSAEHSTDLIKTLYEYTRLEAEIEYKEVNMNDVMVTVLENLTLTLQEKNAEVTYENLPIVNANLELLVQLLQNLIANGIKYCNEKVPKVHVSVENQEHHWKFSVKDNGIGIPKRKFEQIFIPFKRLHSQKEFSGTGLGLATCRKIVEMLRGKIWCESEEGKGTTFYFTLPIPKQLQE